ncbi:hypothetical protein ACIQB5_48365 [Streptomyces sp. NPDC088560]|uniref:hypothetical protein n=1 Tax=Streptomyces sp. NPDC088560 TaxID=3365868 RepID=UPI0037F898A4
MISRQRTAAATVLAAAFLLTGCAHSTGGTGSGKPPRTARPTASAQPARGNVLPTGMIRLGSKLPHDDGEAWVIATGPLKTVRATTKAKGLPPQTVKGQPLTLTYTDGQNTRYLEDTIPGVPAAPPIASGIHPAGADKKTLAFGDWHAGNEITYLRVSPVKVTGTDGSGQRACEIDLTFFNPAKEVSPLSQTPLEANVHVYYGRSLTEADTVKEYTGLSGAFIAPQRTATVTAHFTLPATAVPGPVTIAIGNSDGPRVTYTGTVGN